MKLAIVLENEVLAGGGFNQALNAILQVERLAPDEVALVVVRHRASVDTLRRMVRAEVVLYRPGLADRAMTALVRLDASSVFQRRARLVGPFERFLIRRGVDLVYFVTPSATALTLQRLNMITTVWDACHRDAPEFPEVRAFGELKWRDYVLRGTLPQSLAVLTDSNILAERLVARYGVDRERLIAMPFSAAPHLAAAATEGNTEAAPLNLEPGYFYYPAQFWPHKNHIRLLEALRLLKDRGHARAVVFSGGDMGAKAHARAQAQAFGVGELVRFVGFVSPDEMAGLYLAAATVVIPSYFGPTNLPPIEAWTMRRPLVCSDVMAEQVGDAALVFDPDDATALAEAMTNSLDPETASRLVTNGLRRLEQLSATRVAGEARLSETLERFARRRVCW